MKLIQITALIVAALCSQVAAAEAIKSLTRAEVLADQVVWRQSSMQDFDREDDGADVGSVDIARRWRATRRCVRRLSQSSW